ncbi:hypothetical protein H6P81_000613 [Aristolochia fimbriata]|uniref:Uncharacterized protein n=1 Tax=Aristolochia fimbriata TaxID=158543 RepID=A0AAV7F4N0_ARIFI|nr:hypothetical protein H6P81_000613 [Aristolochia fimbriata]
MVRLGWVRTGVGSATLEGDELCVRRYRAAALRVWAHLVWCPRGLTSNKIMRSTGWRFFVVDFLNPSFHPFNFPTSYKNNIKRRRGSGYLFDPIKINDVLLLNHGRGWVGSVASWGGSAGSVVSAFPQPGVKQQLIVVCEERNYPIGVPPPGPTRTRDPDRLVRIGRERMKWKGGSQVEAGGRGGSTPHPKIKIPLLATGCLAPSSSLLPGFFCSELVKDVDAFGWAGCAGWLCVISSGLLWVECLMNDDPEMGSTASRERQLGRGGELNETSVYLSQKLCCGAFGKKLFTQPSPSSAGLPAASSSVSSYTENTSAFYITTYNVCAGMCLDQSLWQPGGLGFEKVESREKETLLGSHYCHDDCTATTTISCYWACGF